MSNYHFIIPINLKPQPNKYEKVVAKLCAEKFQSDILFIKQGISTTPDIQVIKTKQFWEIKNIKGNGKHTIEDNLRRASHQSQNVIISLLKSPNITTRQVESRIRYVLKTSNLQIKHVILITKDEKAIDIK